jgi:hypothetical protein
MDEDCTQPLSSYPKINLNTTILSLYQQYSIVRNLNNFGVSHALHKWSQMNTIVRGNRSTHTHGTKWQQHTHTQSKRRAQKTVQQRYNSNHMLKSLTSEAIAWSQHLGVVECSRDAWCGAPCARVPFYSPKETRSRWSSIWMALVAFCPRVHRTVWCTPDSEQCNDYEIPDWLVSCSGGIGLSGAPIDCWPSVDVEASCWQLAHRTVRRFTRTVWWIIAVGDLFSNAMN